MVADVELDAGDAAAERREFVGERSASDDAVRLVMDEVGAGGGQHAGKLLPEAAAGAGDQGGDVRSRSRRQN